MSNTIHDTIEVLSPHLKQDERLLYTQVIVRLLNKQYIGVTNQRILVKSKDLQSLSFEEVTDFLKGDSRLFFFFNDKKDGVITEETIVINEVSKIQQVYSLIFPHWRKLRPEITELTKSEQAKLLEIRLIDLKNEFGLTYSVIKGQYRKLEGTFKGYPLLIKLDDKMPINEFSIELKVDNQQNLHFNLSKEPEFLTDWRDWFGRSEYKTGNKQFDDVFYLISDNVRLSKRLFTPSVMRAMLHCQKRANCVWLFGDGNQKKDSSEKLFSTEGTLNDIEGLLDDMLIKEKKEETLKEPIVSTLKFTASPQAELKENGGKIADLLEKGIEHVFEMVNVVDGYYGKYN